MKVLFVATALLSCSALNAQDAYRDSLHAYIQRYIDQHEVVKGDQRKSLRFFPVDEQYKVKARFDQVKDSKWFNMETSGAVRKAFRVYGRISFPIHDTIVVLNLYQSQSLMTTDAYRNLLFLPFTDATSGEESYASGRYIDLMTTDIKGDEVIIDFNKAYNPYCAYVTGKYNCPIPPAENQLKVAIRAGEMKFARH